MYHLPTFYCHLDGPIACPLAIFHPRKASFQFAFIMDGLVVLSSSPSYDISPTIDSLFLVSYILACYSFSYPYFTRSLKETRVALINDNAIPLKPLHTGPYHKLTASRRVMSRASRISRLLFLMTVKQVPYYGNINSYIPMVNINPADYDIFQFTLCPYFWNGFELVYI
ncbi:Citrate synthase-like protein [Dirofilaria immitis]